MTIQEEKRLLRKDIREAEKELSDAYWEQASGAICGRLEQHGLLPFDGRLAELADDCQQFVERVHAADDDVRVVHYPLRAGLHLLHLACAGSAQDRPEGDAGGGAQLLNEKP